STGSGLAAGASALSQLPAENGAATPAVTGPSQVDELPHFLPDASAGIGHNSSGEVAPAATPAANSMAPLTTRPAPSHLPVSFIENAGQWDPSVRFVGQSGPMTAGFENTAIQLQLGGDQPASLGLMFEGTSATASLVGEAKQSGYYNFFL